MRDLIARIEALQSPGGTYMSVVHLPRAQGEDLNCFVTGLVLRELTPVLALPEFEGRDRLADSRRRALGYLLRSRYPCYEHAYAFYPHHAHPFWMGGVLPPDADDTCVIGLELVRAGKQKRDSLDFIADAYLGEYRATGPYARYLSQPWHREGAFLTWFSRREAPNPLDCCVNANVLAMLAVAGRKDHPGYAPAVAMIEAGLDWAGHDRHRLRRLTPFYPDPSLLAEALSHAVASGAGELGPSLARIAPLAAHAPDAATPRKLFSSEDDTVFWEAPVLDLAQQLRIRLTEQENTP